MADNLQTDLEYIRDLLSPYIDGEVTDEERVQVEAALADSPELQRELETLQQTVFLLSRLPAMPAPRPFTLSEAEVQPLRPSKKRPFWLSSWFGGLAAAAAAMLCLAVAFFSLAGRGLAPAADVAMAPAVQNIEAPARSGVATPGEVETAAEAAPAPEERMQSAAVEEEAAAENMTATEGPATQRYAAEAANSAGAPAEATVGEVELAPPALPQSTTEALAAEEAAAEPAESEAMDEAAAKTPAFRDRTASPEPADQVEEQASAQEAATEAEAAPPAEAEPTPAQEVAAAAKAPPGEATTDESLQQAETQPLALEMADEAGAEPTDRAPAAKEASAGPAPGVDSSSPPMTATALPTATLPPMATAVVAPAGPEPTAGPSPTPFFPATETSVPGILPWLIGGGLVAALAIALLTVLFARRKL